MGDALHLVELLRQAEAAAIPLGPKCFYAPNVLRARPRVSRVCFLK